jgi:hypothetical protein
MRILKGFGLSLSRFWNQTIFSGTTVVYAAKGEEITCYQCDYGLHTAVETYKSEVRAARQALRAKGKTPPILPESRITDGVVLIVGVDVSPEGAIATLKALLGRLEEQGLCTGLDEQRKCVFENRSGKQSAFVNRAF